jgi:hypothetical protein
LWAFATIKIRPTKRGHHGLENPLHPKDRSLVLDQHKSEVFPRRLFTEQPDQGDLHGLPAALGQDTPVFVIKEEPRILERVTVVAPIKAEDIP